MNDAPNESASPHGMRKPLLLAAMAASLLMAGHAHAQQAVTLGVIDTKVTETSRDAGIDVTYRHFGMGPKYGEGVVPVTDQKTHGDLIIDSVQDARRRMQDGRRYRIMVANPFVDNGGRLGINYGSLERILEWYQSEGVKVISTTFAAQNEDPRMAAFVKSAGDRGMIVVASIGNGEMDGVPFPAANRGTIAVDGVNYASSFTRRTDAYRRADAVFDGTTGVKTADRRDDGITIMVKSGGNNAAKEVAGSSFAVPRAAAYLAATLGPKATMDDARKALSAVSSKDRPAVIPVITFSTNGMNVASKGPLPAPAAETTTKVASR